jgi:UDP-glucose 4-epimerase
VWVKDIAQANILAAFSNTTGIFNIGSGQELSVNQIADMIISRIGGEKVYLKKPLGEINRMVADISKAKRILEYAPKGKLEMILPDLIDWCKQKMKFI